MNTKSINVGAFPIYARMIGEKFGIKVAFGDRAETDCVSEIVLPRLGLESGAWSALWGLLDHEIAHVRETNFDNVPADLPGAIETIFGSLEDVRVDALQLRKFPGMLNDYEESFRWMIGQEMMSSSTDGTELEHAEKLIFFWANYYLTPFRAIFEPLYKQVKADAVERFGAPVVARAETILRQLATAASSGDAVNIAYRLYQCFADFSQEPPATPDCESDQCQSDGQGQSDQQAQSDGTNGDTSSGGDDANTDASSSPGSSSSTQASAPEGSGSQAGACSSSSSDGSHGEEDGVAGSTGSASNGGTSSDSLSPAQRAAMQNLLQQLDSNETGRRTVGWDQLKDEMGSKHSANSSQDNFAYSFLPAGSLEENPSYGKEMYHTAMANAHRLRNVLRQLLYSRSRQLPIAGYAGRKLATRALSRVVAGDYRIFEKRVDNPRALDAAIHIVGDASVSMESGKESPLDIANQAAVALAAALQGIRGVTVGVSIFRGGEYIDLVKHGASAQAGAAYFPISSSGSTPLAEAIRNASVTLLSRDVSKRIMFVVTDGEPNNGAAVLHAIDSVNNAIHFVGVGIGSKGRAVESYFGEHVVIDSVEELGESLFGLTSMRLAG